MQRNVSLISANVAVLRQARDLVAGIDARLYSSVEGIPVKSGAGAHVRHCLDFYDCFLAGLRVGRVDYNLRERDEATAHDPERALERLEATIHALEARPILGPHTSLMVRAEGPGDPRDPSTWSRSSVGRELQFLLSHSVHHFAIIALTLRLLGVEPGEAFGVAPSTLTYWRSAS
jgi:hypothetical protein